MSKFMVAQRVSSVAFEIVEAESAEAARAAVEGQLGKGEMLSDFAGSAVLADDGPILTRELAPGENPHEVAQRILAG